MLHIFQYDNEHGKVELEKGNILLIKEFSALMNNERNICEEDKTGEKHLRAFREFTYIWLAIDCEYFYKDYSNQDRHNVSLKDANLTEEECKLMLNKYKNYIHTDYPAFFEKTSTLNNKSIILKYINNYGR